MAISFCRIPISIPVYELTLQIKGFVRRSNGSTALISHC